MNSEQCKEIILNTSEPLVFKNTIKWNILQWSLQDWNELLKSEEMEFRIGNFAYSKEPQWEKQTEMFKGKFDFFLNYTKESDPKKWLYFDYKYLKNFLLNATNLRNDITWATLGFPEATCDESTIWIGSKGAHTPCHIDTYGFNLVSQIFGKKLWVLFPPDENLRPTRMPYEESSIYSKLNFFSPTIKGLQGLSNAHILTLEPGDVLYVPHGWWHYVENLDTAISINTWVPSLEDDSERIKEALVQFIVKQICDFSKTEIQNEILNPNMQEILKDDSRSFIDMIMTTLSVYEKNAGGSHKKIKTNLQEEIIEKDLYQTFKNPDFIKKVPKATHKEWMDFLHTQSVRFKNEQLSKNQADFENETVERTNIVRLLKAFTDPDVISLIQSKLLKNK